MTVLRRGKAKNLTNKECNFSYRHSIFKDVDNKDIILSVVFELQSGDRAKIKQKMKEIIMERNKKFNNYSCAGCVFKNIELKEVEIDEKHMIDLLKLVENKKITDNVAAKLLEKLVEKPFDVKEYVKKEGLEAVSDVSELEKYCKEAIRENSKAVEDYKKGEKRALNFIVGVIMKKTRGKATPKEVNDTLKRLIK